MDRRTFLAVVAGAGLSGCSDGTTGPTDQPQQSPTDAGGTQASGTGSSTEPVEEFTLESPAFSDGQSIPRRFTADGEDTSPPLEISGVPGSAATLALVVDDPDAPGGTFVHWLLWNLPVKTTAIPAGVPQTETVDSLGGARQGKNGFGAVGYRGPAPPADDGPHRYRFTLTAVERSLDVPPGSERAPLSTALEDATVARTRLVGTYDR